MGTLRIRPVCEHDELYIMIDPAVVSEEDKTKLEELGFSPYEDQTFLSYKYGSA
jgi:hypothetical protein